MPRTIDQALVAEARRLSHDGVAQREIAARMGVDRSTVRRWLGARDRAGSPGRADVPDTLIAGLRAEGLSYAQIGARVGMSASGVRERHWAVTGRPRRGR